MRTQVFISVCLFLCTLPASGQNYQTVYPGRENCFSPGFDGNIVCLRIDSLSEGTSTVLHPSRVNLSTSDECYSPFAGSWIGKEIEIRENGENVFFNYTDEPVIINTHAAVGDEWVAYEGSGSLHIKATVVAHELMDFLQLTDSVKTITFQAYNAAGDSIEMDLNQMQVLLSKHHGWVQTLSFYFFPDFRQAYPQMELREMQLVGLSEPQTGINNLTWFEVYDFQPNDELHVLEERGYWVGEFDGHFQTTETRTIYKYLDRQDYTDSIKYSFVRTQRIHQQWTDSLSFRHDTLTEYTTPNPEFDKLPFEPTNEHNNIESEYAYNRLKKDDFRVKVNYSEVYFHSGGDCWQPLLIDGAVPYHYYEGLGGPYYSRQAMWGSLYRHELVYYQKNGKTWGTPLDVSGVESDIKPPIVKIYPNPVRESFTVHIDPSLAGEHSLTMMDINSRSVHHQNVSSGLTTVNVSHLPPGIYFCIISNKQGVFYRHKMLMQ